MTQEYASEGYPPLARRRGADGEELAEAERSGLDWEAAPGLGARDDADIAHTPRWRQAIPGILAIYLVSRLLIVLVAAGLTALPYPDVDTWTDRPILSALTGSDAVYYLGIAAEGYHVEAVKESFHDWVFFPLYPVTVRVASIATLGDIALAGVLVANLAFLAAVMAMYALSVRHLGHETAVRAVAFLAMAPGAVAFTMAYSDSLFLLVCLAAFLAAERRRWALTGVFYGLAAFTRLPGILLGIPLLVLMLQAHGWRPTRAMAWLAAGPLALAAFAAWLGIVIGDPLAFLAGQSAWALAPMLGNADVPARIHVLPMMLIATLLAYTFLLVYLRPDRIALPYVLLAILSLLAVVASMRLQSVARYVAVAWPFAWVMANRRSSWFWDTWPYLTTSLYILHAFLHFTQVLAP